jgi:hypothetical protein
VNPRPAHVHKRVFLKKPAKVIVIKKTVVR